MYRQFRNSSPLCHCRMERQVRRSPHDHQVLLPTHSACGEVGGSNVVVEAASALHMAEARLVARQRQKRSGGIENDSAEKRFME